LSSSECRHGSTKWLVSSPSCGRLHEVTGHFMEPSYSAGWLVTPQTNILCELTRTFNKEPYLFKWFHMTRNSKGNWSPELTLIFLFLVHFNGFFPVFSTFPSVRDSSRSDGTAPRPSISSLLKTACRPSSTVIVRLLYMFRTVSNPWRLAIWSIPGRNLGMVCISEVHLRPLKFFLTPGYVWMLASTKNKPRSQHPWGSAEVIKWQVLSGQWVIMYDTSWWLSASATLLQNILSSLMAQAKSWVNTHLTDISGVELEARRRKWRQSSEKHRVPEV
jgi:hypothetical protein